MILGNPAGRFFVVEINEDCTLGRWDSYEDAEAHAGEHQAMDPEAELRIYDSAEQPF